MLLGAVSLELNRSATGCEQQGVIGKRRITIVKRDLPCGHIHGLHGALPTLDTGLGEEGFRAQGQPIGLSLTGKIFVYSEECDRRRVGFPG